ncbi:MAG: hypothetical protein JXQ29_04250 [Planctomycetes bacterium]|nr:hypothetical protein [Planctomycetota bacterium]
MAISVSPQPSDGPLRASGPNVTLSVSTPNGAILTAAIKTTSGTFIPIEHCILNDGTTVLVLNLPPGGVPSGSTLILAFDEHPDSLTVVKYQLL